VNLLLCQELLELVGILPNQPFPMKVPDNELTVFTVENKGILVDLNFVPLLSLVLL